LALYYAIGDTRTPMLVSLLDLGVFVALAVALSGSMGHVGVSLAVSGSRIAQAALLVTLLGRHLPLGSLAQVLPGLGKTCIALAPASVLAGWTGRSLLTAGIGSWLPGLVALLVFGTVFLGMAKLVRSEELSSLVKPILRRYGGSSGKA